MKIGDLAKKTGCKVVTIRYYEKVGLLAEPERNQGNYRIYTEADLGRLEFIMYCRRHGMTLAEIRELLAFRDRPRSDCSWVGELVDNHIANVDAQIKSLEHLKQHLEALRKRCAGGADKHAGGCGIIASLGRQDIRCENCTHARLGAG